MELKVKFFDELTTRELYEMLKARAENTLDYALRSNTANYKTRC